MDMSFSPEYHRDDQTWAWPGEGKQVSKGRETGVLGKGNMCSGVCGREMCVAWVMYEGRRPGQDLVVKCKRQCPISQAKT